MRFALAYSDDRVVLPSVIVSARGNHFLSFVIDTGSTQSLLSPKDMATVQLPAGSAAKESIGFGGATFDATLLNKVRIKISGEDKRIVELRIPLRALKTRRISEEKKNLAESLPSILGMDFLKQNEFSLYVCPAEKIAYLEKND